MHDSRHISFHEIASEIIGYPPRVEPKEAVLLVSGAIRGLVDSGLHDDIDIIECAISLLKLDQVDNAACALLALKRGHPNLVRDFLSRKDMGAIFLFYFLDDYRNRMTERDASAARYIPAVAEMVAGSEAGTVLDVGCGDGSFGEALKALAADVVLTGVDFYRKADNRIAEHYDRFDERDAFDGSFDARADAIVLSAVLPHLDLNAALKFLGDARAGYFLFNIISSECYLDGDWRKTVFVYDAGAFEAGLRSLGLDFLSTKSVHYERVWYLASRSVQRYSDVWDRFSGGL